MHKHLLWIALALLALPVTTRAQNTYQATLVSNAPCAGIVLYPVLNVNQTRHTATVFFGSGNPPQSFLMRFIGIDNSGNSFVISDTATGGAPGGAFANQIIGNGYYPTVEVQVLCTAATGGGPTYTLSYSGSTTAPFAFTGAALSGQIDKEILTNAPAGTTTALPISLIPPFGSEAGALAFEYFGAAGPSGSTLTVACSLLDGFVATESVFTPVTVGLEQVFPLPDFPCPFVNFEYSSGGTSTATYSAHFIFNPPGFVGGVGDRSAHIVTATDTIVDSGFSALLRRITVNTPVAGTISIYDVPSSSCTGTPSTGLVGTITLTSSSQPVTLTYDKRMAQGICIVTSATADITVTYQ